jgi:hypothetical protein
VAQESAQRHDQITGRRRKEIFDEGRERDYRVDGQRWKLGQALE